MNHCGPPPVATMLHHDIKTFLPFWSPSPSHWAAAGSTGGRGWSDGMGLGKDPLGVHLEWGGARGGGGGQRGPSLEHAHSEIFYVIGSPLWDSPCPPAQTDIYSEALREERGVGSREQVMATCGTRTDSLETSTIPLPPDQSPSSLSFI